jgi:phosphoglycerate dehydrogenase-like enzyme
MEKHKVVVTRPLDQTRLRKITDRVPRIELLYASDLFMAERNGDYSSKERFDAILSQADVVSGRWPPENVIARAPRLQWVHSMLAGVDHDLYRDIFRKGIIVTSSKGLHGTQASELVLGMMLMLAKQAPRCFEHKLERRWERFFPLLLNSKTLGVVGLGNIGKEVARLGKAFGMRVMAVRRSTRRPTRAKNVDALLPKDQLKALLSESDFVVITLPSTPETEKIISEQEIGWMKPDACIINVARGSVIDENALVRALEEGRIAGAGLDAFAREPLPPESRLWALPNVVITPHIGGAREDMDDIVIDLFCENLERYLRGEELINVVEERKGY